MRHDSCTASVTVDLCDQNSRLIAALERKLSIFLPSRAPNLGLNSPLGPWNYARILAGVTYIPEVAIAQDIILTDILVIVRTHKHTKHSGRFLCKITLLLHGVSFRGVYKSQHQHQPNLADQFARSMTFGDDILSSDILLLHESSIVNRFSLA